MKQKMKKMKTILAALVFSATAALAQSGQKFTFSGQLSDVNDSLEIWAMTVGENDFGKFAQIPCEKGKFSFTTVIVCSTPIQPLYPVLSSSAVNSKRWPFNKFTSVSSVIGTAPSFPSLASFLYGRTSN